MEIKFILKGCAWVYSANAYHFFKSLEMPFGIYDHYDNSFRLKYN